MTGFTDKKEGRERDSQVTAKAPIAGTRKCEDVICLALSEMKREEAGRKGKTQERRGLEEWPEEKNGAKRALSQKMTQKQKEPVFSGLFGIWPQIIQPPAQTTRPMMCSELSRSCGTVIDS